MARRNTKPMEPGGTLTGGGYYGRNTPAEEMKHQTKNHYSSEEDDVQINYGSCRGARWEERLPDYYSGPLMPTKRRRNR